MIRASKHGLDIEKIQRHDLFSLETYNEKLLELKKQGSMYIGNIHWKHRRLVPKPKSSFQTECF